MTKSKLTKAFEESRKQDVMIARFLGFKNIGYAPAYGDYFGFDEDLNKLTRVPCYENSIASAWKIIDHIQFYTNLYFKISSAGGGGSQYRCDLTTDEDAGNLQFYVIENTPARAIVGAFLKWYETL